MDPSKLLVRAKLLLNSSSIFATARCFICWSSLIFCSSMSIFCFSSNLNVRSDCIFAVYSLCVLIINSFSHIRASRHETLSCSHLILFPMSSMTLCFELWSSLSTYSSLLSASFSSLALNICFCVTSNCAAMVFFLFESFSSRVCICNCNFFFSMRWYSMVELFSKWAISKYWTLACLSFNSLFKSCEVFLTTCTSRVSSCRPFLSSTFSFAPCSKCDCISSIFICWASVIAIFSEITASRLSDLSCWSLKQVTISFSASVVLICMDVMVESFSKSFSSRFCTWVSWSLVSSSTSFFSASFSSTSLSSLDRRVSLWVLSDSTIESFFNTDPSKLFILTW